MNQGEIIRRFAADPREFRDALLIDAGNGPVRLGSVLDDWQHEDFAAMDPAWRRIAGHSIDVQYRRGWWERPRGHSKSQDAATMALWSLAFSPRAVSGVVCACDRDQASLIRQGVERLLSFNPWLAEVIRAAQWKVTNARTGSSLTIMASDAASSWGLLPDFVIADEVSMWLTDAMWVSLMHAVAKKPNALMLAALNAGFTESWAFETREKVRTDPNWYFNSLDGPRASWIVSRQLDEQKRLLPAPAFRRLWLNEWSRGAGDALEQDDIEAAITAKGPMTGREEGTWCFGIGVDAAVKRDNAAVVVVGADCRSRRVRVADVRVWRPGPNGRIDLLAMKEGIRELAHQFRAGAVLFDPYQMEAVGQELEAEGLNMFPMPFTGANKTKMAVALLEAFRSRQIDLYPHPLLIEDLGRLVIAEKPYGFALEAARTASGHADTAFALSCILPTALDAAAQGEPYHDPNDPWGNRQAVTTDELLHWAELNERCEAAIEAMNRSPSGPWSAAHLY